MNRKPKTLQLLFIRIIAILLHAILNFIAVSYLTDFDLTGSWLVFVGFMVLVVLLSFLFLKHLVSFIFFLKNN